MTPIAIQADAVVLGSRQKVCPACSSIVAKTAPNCYACHHKFIGEWNRNPEIPRQQPGMKPKGTPIVAKIIREKQKPGRKPKYDPLAPDQEQFAAATEKLIAHATARPAAELPFDPIKLADGGLLLRWTDTPIVELRLTKNEWAKVRKVAG